MAGSTWTGKPEQDDSTGNMQVQVGITVVAGAKPVGSIVIGLKLGELN
jgi:hypothetical protein